MAKTDNTANDYTFMHRHGSNGVAEYQRTIACCQIMTRWVHCTVLCLWV